MRKRPTTSAPRSPDRAGNKGAVGTDASEVRRARLAEVSAVAALTVLAALLRLQGLGRMGLTHFDEGVYAMAGLWSVTGRGLSADWIAYAPPGYPILIGVAYLALGVSDAASLLVSIACGSLTVPAVAWIGRRTFGPGAGAIAAALAAVSLAHVAFSRKAMTDAPFLLAWIAAIGLGMRFLERPCSGRALALGLAVGLAQNLKYYGWLAGAAVVLAASVPVVNDPAARARGSIARTFGWGVLAIATACLVYAPWYLFVDAHGGYASLVRHQRGYFLGPSAWPADLRQQFAQGVALSGGPAWGLLTATAVGLALAVVRRDPPGSTPWRGRIAAAVASGALLVALPNLGWWAGLAWLPRLLTDPRSDRRLIGAWWLCQSLLTPLYLPYARLWLPLHAAGWVLLAGAVATIARVGLPPSGSWRRPGPFASYASLVLAIGFAADQASGARAIPVAEVFAPTDGLRDAAVSLGSPTSLGGETVHDLRVLARRPLAFYLALDGRLPYRLIAGGAGESLGPAAPGDWAIIDLALDPTTVDPIRTELKSNRSWALAKELGPIALDPVTRLDVRPASAYENSGSATGLWLLGPARPSPRR